jgi:hypothetical protein
MQTYREYLETMRVYNFSPLPYPTWLGWVRHHEHERFNGPCVDQCQRDQNMH